MKKPLIYHILPSLGRGGAERVVFDVSSRLASHGFRVRIISLFERGGFWDEVRERDIRFTQVVDSVRGSRIELLRKLTRIIFCEHERRPAIVHTHLFGGDFWTELARDLHDLIAFEDRGTMKFVSTLHNIDYDDSTVRRIGRRWAMRHKDHVIAVSEDVKTYAVQDLRIPTQRVTVIENGIDMEAFGDRSDEPFHDPPRFVTVGRLEPQKGHAMLFEALKQVPPPWELHLVGDGTLRRDLEELAERLGIASRVYFHGEQNDVAEHLLQSDLFLFPSQWEGMGIALLEAMAVGLPILSSDLPAIRAFAPTERLLPHDDPAEWTRAIIATLQNPNPERARARHDAVRIRNDYSIDRMVDRYVRVYKTLV